MSSPIWYQRPLRCQSSAGCTTGSVTSCPPMASISSRMICSILGLTRWPKRQVIKDAGGNLLDHAGAHQQLVS